MELEDHTTPSKLALVQDLQSVRLPLRPLALSNFSHQHNENNSSWHPAVSIAPTKGRVHLRPGYDPGTLSCKALCDPRVAHEKSFAFVLVFPVNENKGSVSELFPLL